MTPPPGSARRYAIAPVWTPTHPGTGLATVQELEHEHQATLAERDPVRQPAELEAPDATYPPHMASMIPAPKQLRTRLVAAGAHEPVIQARTLADLGQAREARGDLPLKPPMRGQQGRRIAS